MIELGPDNEVTFFVSGSTPVAKLGSAIAHGVYADKKIRLRAIGAGAISQAQKAIAVARGYAAPRGYSLASVPSFEEVDMAGDGKRVTALVFLVITTG